MDNQLKEKIRASMMEHLTSVGYPNITNDQIIQQLPHMWNKLSREGLLDTLTSKGFGYDHFVQIALQKRNESEIMEEINRHFNGGFRGK